MEQLNLFELQNADAKVSLCNDEGIVASDAPAFVFDGGASRKAAEELLRHFGARRMRRLANTDLTLLPAEEPLAEVEEVVEKEKTVESKKKIFAPVLERIRAFFALSPTWFDTKAVVAEKKTRKRTASAFVGIAVLAVCLSLIVGGSILVTHGETVNNRLKKEISLVSAQIEDLESSIQLQNDVLLIRELAANECGMIGEEYVRSQTLSLGGGERVETYPDGKPEGVGLSALLSAIGIGN